MNLTESLDQVFLSHNSADKPFVEAIAVSLERAQLRPWLDKWHLTPGEAWQPAIERALRDCRCCVVFVGPSGLGAWQHEEMRTAINRRVTTTRAGEPFRVIPVLLPGAVRGYRSDLPEFLTAATWVEFRSNDDAAALRTLERAIRGLPPRAERPRANVECPYRGLEAFDLPDADLFFGREAVTDWLLSMLRGTQSTSGPRRFVALVGASGSGKSSVARAGVLAALKRGAIDGSQDWPVTICRPGARPLENLAGALQATAGISLGQGLDSDLLRALIEALYAHADTLHLTAHSSRFHSAPTGRHVILVDQFEEVFTECQDERQRKAFIDNLLYAGRVPGGRKIVLVTMRADFYEACAAHDELRSAISEHQFLLGPLNADELRNAIEQPMLLSQGTVEPGLTELLLADMAGQDQALPLLQHALHQLWQAATDARLSVDAYRDLGGLQGALKKHADSVYQQLTADEQSICRDVMVALVNLTDPSRETRRRVALDDLAAHSTRSGDVKRVTRHLASARLVSITTATSTSDVSSTPTVEVIHEALIRGWPMLGNWLDDDRQELRARQQFHDRVKEWRTQNQYEDLLYSGGLLRHAVSWASEHPGQLTADESDFLNASVGQLVDQLRTIKLERVPEFLNELRPFLERARPSLASLVAESPSDSPERLVASLALLPVDEGQLAFLRDRLLDGDLVELPLVRDALLSRRATLVPWLWSVLDDQAAIDSRRRFRAAIALATFDPVDSDKAAARWTQSAEFVARQLVEAVAYNPAQFGVLVDALRPAGRVLLAPLSEVLRHDGDGQRRAWATNLLASFAADQPETLADLACDADPHQYGVLFTRLQPYADRAIATARSELQRQPADDAPQEAKDLLAKRQANAAVTLLRLNEPTDVWPLWHHSTDPRRRSYLVHRVGLLGVDPRTLAARLEEEDDVSAQRALILALGEMIPAGSAPHAELVRDLSNRLERLYREHSDPGLHGAAEWTLRRWKQNDRLDRADRELISARPDSNRRWYLNSQGQTLILIPGPVEFLMGSPTEEDGRVGGPNDKTEEQHSKRIGRSFAVAACPVTVEQFLRFRSNHSYQQSYSPSPDYPINRVTWYEATAYCNWLSEQDGLPRDQWCYDPQQEFAEGMRVPEDFLERTGYRLPTESEWEYACRADAVTSRYYGESEELLGRYAWYTKMSGDKAMLPVGSLKPSDLGLFDMLGNAYEWCHDPAFSCKTEGNPTEDDPNIAALDDRTSRVLRGGSFNAAGSGIRSAHRLTWQPGYRSNVFGFRVARTYR